MNKIEQLSEVRINIVTAITAFANGDSDGAQIILDSVLDTVLEIGIANGSEGVAASLGTIEAINTVGAFLAAVHGFIADQGEAENFEIAKN